MTITFTINVTLAMILILLFLWIFLPIIFSWGKVVAKNNRKEKLIWKINSVIVCLPSLIFLSILASLLTCSINLLNYIGKGIMFSLNRLRLPKDS